MGGCLAAALAMLVACCYCNARDDYGPGPPRRLSALGVFLYKSILYWAFVWARRAHNGQKRRISARGAVKRERRMSGLYDPLIDGPD